MTPQERAALTALRFNVAPTPDDIWQPSPFDVPEIHRNVVREIIDGLTAARDATPTGVIVEGRAGSGKTHMLGAVRQMIQQQDGGYFFLVKVISGRTFWENTAVGILDGLTQKTGPWGMQLTTFLRRLTASLVLESQVRDAIAGSEPLTPDNLDTFIRALRAAAGRNANPLLDTARALALYASQDFAAQDVGLAHLMSVTIDQAERAAWSMTAASRNPHEIVQDISRLLAMTKTPTIIAVDQLDTMFAQSNVKFSLLSDDVPVETANALSHVADGILTLRNDTQRTLVVVSVLPDALALLDRYASSPVLDRFRHIVVNDLIGSPAIARKLVALRFAARFRDLHFTPDYDTWPIKHAAFKDATTFSPRGLLRRIDRHVTLCLAKGEVIDLGNLDDEPEEVQTKPPISPPINDKFAALDRQFRDLVSAADVNAAVEHTSEDAVMPMLLAAGLAAWIDEHAPTGTTFKQDPLPGTKPAFHARLVEVIEESLENEAHWAFRGIASPAPVAVINRVKAASTAAGLDLGVPQRRLVLLRPPGGWPSGPKCNEVLGAFRAAGGVDWTIDNADLKVFAALKAMRGMNCPDLAEWLVDRRPASKTALFQHVLGDRSATTDPGTTTDLQPAIPADAEPVQAGPKIILGRAASDGRPLSLRLESLRRHTAIFAGSGSGKTVLIRRIVEECALAGVSSIVLDPNNDLARLGDGWPQPPSAWQNGDAERAADYLQHTDVVIWTPRITAGRPLAFQPLPDFGPVLDTPDEFNRAIDAAVAALAPRARVDGKTKQAEQGRAVVKEALLWYARHGGTGLRGLVDLLSDLPPDLSQFAKGSKLALDAGETLKAAMINDSLFGGDGVPVDPGLLLQPAPGKRARVSVISFIGLTSDAEKQGFVNQLQMALFAWVKLHPAGDRPLGGLFVMDEAQSLAPATGNTPCTASTIALASQARKYGLGLVFATQAPKALHNQISGNATTQFFGLLNHPTQIDAARELAQAKGSKLPDIGLLGTGEFYVASEDQSFVKIHTPLCLTHHAKAPLSPEEVLARTTQH